MSVKTGFPGAGEGNRTLASSLGSSHSTTELHPRQDLGREVDGFSANGSVKIALAPDLSRNDISWGSFYFQKKALAVGGRTGSFLPQQRV